MMETIKDFFKHINYRLSSPLFFSFIIAWLIFNWPVTLNLLIRDIHLLNTDGYHSYVDLIKKTVTVKTGILLPLISAIAYTALNPVISMITHAFYTWIQKSSDMWDLKILRGSNISIDKYLRLKENVEKREAILKKAIDDEREIVAKFERTTTENLSLKQEVNKLRADSASTINELKESLPDTSYRIIQGKWEITNTSQNQNTSIERITVRGNAFYVINNNKEIKAALIQRYQHDTKNNLVFFVRVYTDEYIERNPKQIKVIVTELNYNELTGNFSGSENYINGYYYKSIN